MLRIVRQLSVLGLATLVLLLLCDQAVRRWTPPTIFSQKLTAIEQQDLSPVQVAILGTSRPYHGLDPAALPWPSYSLCDLGQPLDLSYQILRRQVDRMPQLKAVVIGLDEFSFGADDTGLPSAEDYLTHGYTVPHATWMTRWRARFPLLRWRRNLLPQLLAAAIGKDFYDTTPVEDADRPSDPQQACLLTRSGFFYLPARAGDVSDGLGMRRAEDRRDSYRPALREASRATLTTLIDFALSRNVRVILLRTPVHAAYRRHVDTQMLQDFESDLATVTHAYRSDQVEVLSYWDRDFQDAEYNDVDHLNGAGAQHLARLLANDANSFIQARVASSRTAVPASRGWCDSLADKEASEEADSPWTRPASEAAEQTAP